MLEILGGVAATMLAITASSTTLPSRYQLYCLANLDSVRTYRQSLHGLGTNIVVKMVKWPREVTDKQFLDNLVGH